SVVTPYLVALLLLGLRIRGIRVSLPGRACRGAAREPRTGRRAVSESHAGRRVHCGRRASSWTARALHPLAPQPPGQSARRSLIVRLLSLVSKASPAGRRGVVPAQ